MGKFGLTEEMVNSGFQRKDQGLGSVVLLFKRHSIQRFYDARFRKCCRREVVSDKKSEKSFHLDLTQIAHIFLDPVTSLLQPHHFFQPTVNLTEIQGFARHLKINTNVRDRDQPIKAVQSNRIEGRFQSRSQNWRDLFSRPSKYKILLTRTVNTSS